jgi:r-opsin
VRSFKIRGKNNFFSRIGYLACAWIYGSVWILPPLFGWNRFILEGFGTSCTFDYVSKDIWDRTFILVLVTGGFVIPLMVILLSYGFILMKLSQRSRRFISQNNDDNYSNQQGSIYCFNELNVLNEHRARNGTVSTPDCTIDDHNMTRNFRRTEARATRTALFICTLFCSAWGPYSLMALFSVFGFNYIVNAYSTAMLGMFTKVAACMNPLVYALSLNGFREQLCSYSKCMYQCDGKQHHHLIPLNQKKFSNLPNRSPIRQLDPINRVNV